MSRAHPTIYLAGPITGLGSEEYNGWRNEVARSLRPILCFSPLRGKTGAKDSVLETALCAPKAVNQRDHFDCLTCDLILVNLIGAKRISIGTVMEIAWGFAYRKPVVVAMEPGNPHEHVMLKDSSSFILPDLSTAVQVVKTILFPELSEREDLVSHKT